MCKISFSDLGVQDPGLVLLVKSDMAVGQELFWTQSIPAAAPSWDCCSPQRRTRTAFAGKERAETP